MASLICVGIATLDVVNQLARYPDEDEEVRALAQQIRVGGNAANTARVLAQLGVQAYWVGNLSDQTEAALVHQAFDEVGVNYSLAPVVAGACLPTSYVALSRETGSRSIVHYRDMPEYAFEHFSTLDLRFADWVHFEGRPVEQLSPMLRRVRRMCGLPLSMEVEKPREGIEFLFDEADVLMFSRDYVQSQGVEDPAQWLTRLPPGNMASCTWGEQGAWLRDFTGKVHHAPAYLPARVVDTLGAGDVFNAGLLHGITAGLLPDQLLHAAVRLAGEKCGREGILIND